MGECVLVLSVIAVISKSGVGVRVCSRTCRPGGVGRRGALRLLKVNVDVDVVGVGVGSSVSLLEWGGRALSLEYCMFFLAWWSRSSLSVSLALSGTLVSVSLARIIIRRLAKWSVPVPFGLVLSVDPVPQYVSDTGWNKVASVVLRRMVAWSIRANFCCMASNAVANFWLFHALIRSSASVVVAFW